MSRESRGNQDRQALDRELARLPRDVTTAITWRMEQLDMNKAELARKMGVSPGRVSQILSGDENLTLRTLAHVFVALNAQLDVELVPNDEDSRRDDAWRPGSLAGSGTYGRDDLRGSFSRAAALPSLPSGRSNSLSERSNSLSGRSNSLSGR
jgi:transcriptional regulator with XRE-family HTH domain